MKIHLDEFSIKYRKNSVSNVTSTKMQVDESLSDVAHALSTIIGKLIAARDVARVCEHSSLLASNPSTRESTTLYNSTKAIMSKQFNETDFILIRCLLNLIDVAPPSKEYLVSDLMGGPLTIHSENEKISQIDDFSRLRDEVKKSRIISELKSYMDEKRLGFFANSHSKAWMAR